VGSILDYASVSYSGMARTHFLKLKRLQYRGLGIVLGLMQSTPTNSLGILSGVSPLAERCTSIIDIWLSYFTSMAIL
jgi:hypothetical protein